MLSLQDTAKSNAQSIESWQLLCNAQKTTISQLESDIDSKKREVNSLRHERDCLKQDRTFGACLGIVAAFLVGLGIGYLLF